MYSAAVRWHCGRLINFNLRQWRNSGNPLRFVAVSEEGPDTLTHLRARGAGGVDFGPRCTESGQQFPRDTLYGVNAVMLAKLAEPGQLTGIFADDLFRDALVFLAPEKDVNTALSVPVFLLGLYFGSASGELILDFPLFVLSLSP